ncbi:hypothetical protein T492DRAFT_1150130 [Pavlovales sp. CCMP2436]|nr:hypothetical protein T492DRAFT_1150130 [Pavlovales sp. CCMP2436]|mmetsp:Transcript_7833/g.20551  ORF Transcript_7833/g.20551 Transcript_7833/m.20551 type:complete len:380 (-) Transcript_7833:168-1307(-)
MGEARTRLAAALCLTMAAILSTDAAVPRHRGLVRRAFARPASVRLSAGEQMDPAAIVLLDAVEEWVRTQRVSDIVPEKKLRSLLKAVRSDVSFWERQHEQYERLWFRVEAQLRLDARPVREVLGEELSQDALIMLEQFDSAPFMRSAMQSDAVEKLLGSVLYEALFAFIKSADILGNMMSSLPLFGPMRDQIIRESKKSLDAVMGAQISGFLGSYSKEAVKSAVSYVDGHGADFSKAQRRAVEELLNRPFNSVLPSAADTALIRDTVWLRVRHVRAPNEDEIISSLYAEFGEETIDTLLPLANPRVDTEHMPRIFVKGRDLLAGNLHNFILSEQGKLCLQQLQALPAGASLPPVAGTAAVAPIDAQPAADNPGTPDDWD